VRLRRTPSTRHPATAIVTSTQVTRRVLPRLGVRKILLAGLTVTGLGQVWLFTISSTGSYQVNVLGGIMITAFGTGLTFPTTSVAVTSGVGPGERGLAGGLFVTAQQVGQAVGLAGLATIAATQTNAHDGSLVSVYKASFLAAIGISVVALLIVAKQMKARTAPKGPHDSDRTQRLSLTADPTETHPMPRPNRPLRIATIVETAPLTPHMVRIFVEGPELEGFAVGEFTDRYRRVSVRRDDPHLHRPRLGCQPVAANARFRRPRRRGRCGALGSHRPSRRHPHAQRLRRRIRPVTDVDWHLMVGDESVIRPSPSRSTRSTPGRLSLSSSRSGPPRTSSRSAPQAICACTGYAALSARARSPTFSCRQSARSTFPRAVVKHSSTARPKPSCASAVTSSRSEVSTETTYRPPDTGS
jgi:hypothetical protein